MRKYVLCKIFTASLFSLFSVIPATVSAENESYWGGWNRAKPSMEAPVNSEVTNPWHLSDEQKRTSKFWSPTKQQARQYQQQDMRHSDNQAPYYQSQGGAVPYDPVPDKQVWNQNQMENSTHERYVTQDIIDLLNRQEAHHYSSLNNEEEQYYQNSQAPLYGRQYEQYGQGYSASPSVVLILLMMFPQYRPGGRHRMFYMAANNSPGCLTRQSAGFLLFMCLPLLAIIVQLMWTVQLVGWAVKFLIRLHFYKTETDVSFQIKMASGS